MKKRATYQTGYFHSEDGKPTLLSKSERKFYKEYKYAASAYWDAVNNSELDKDIVKLKQVYDALADEYVKSGLFDKVSATEKGLDGINDYLLSERKKFTDGLNNLKKLTSEMKAKKAKRKAEKEAENERLEAERIRREKGKFTINKTKQAKASYDIDKLIEAIGKVK